MQDRCQQCYLRVQPITSTRCENCLGCIDGIRCYDAPIVLCNDCANLTPHTI
jgi:hypothetical protein